MEYTDIESNRKYSEKQVVKILYWTVNEPGFNEYTGESTESYWWQIHMHLTYIEMHS